MNPVKISPKQFWSWADTVIISLPHSCARVVYLYGRHANESGKAWPSRSRIAEIAGVSPRSVTRALAEGVKAGLLLRVESTENTPSQTFILTLPNGKHEHVRGRQDCLGGWTPVSRGGGQICLPKRTSEENQEKNQPEDIIMSGSDYSEGNRKSVADDDEPSAERMRQELNRPIQLPARPSVPDGCLIVMRPDRVKLNEVSVDYHRAAWTAHNARGSFWPTSWIPWLLQFLPYMTMDQHREWMGHVATVSNVPVLKWHTRVVKGCFTGKRSEWNSGTIEKRDYSHERGPSPMEVAQKKWGMV